MVIQPVLKKMLINKMAECLNGRPEGLRKLLDYYRKAEIQLDPADQNFIDSLAASLQDGTSFAKIFLRIGRETSKSYRKKVITNLIFNQFIAGKAKRKSLCQGEDVVPQFITVSPSMKCNLRCAGCYAGLYGKDDELTEQEVDRLLEEIRGMGVYFAVISGGEPYLQKEMLLRLFRKYNDMFFLTYTNGTLIDAELAAHFGRLGNVAPAISVEGWEKETDNRRGTGTWSRILSAMGHLRRNGVMFGISVTATRSNLDVVTDDAFAEFFLDRGAIFGWYFMFMPVGKDPMLQLMLTPQQRLHCGRRVNALREKYPLFLADFWNDGEIVGGCLAAGRQYLHVLNNGSVEPCVFAHFGRDNIREKPLLEIVNSPFFKAIRRQFPYNANANLKRPCMIIDNPQVLRDAVHRHGAVPGHAGSGDLLDEPFTVKAIDDYARSFAELVDPEWEKMINDPGNRWYKEGPEYQDLFYFKRQAQHAPGVEPLSHQQHKMGSEGSVKSAA